jgi:predicted RNA binding protein YcfA (HicA-like mRNA interferase family)
MVRALHRAGFEDDHSTGGHLVLRHPENHRRVTVPMHPGDLAVGLIHDILDEAGLSVEEFIALLK